MKALTMRDLNRKTATVLDALERGETFEVRRNGKAVGYLTPTHRPTQKMGWKAHFQWLQKQKRKGGGGFVEELEDERRRMRDRDGRLDKLT